MANHTIENLLFDAGELTPLPRRRRPPPLTPDQRDARRQARERWLRRQMLLIADAFPPKQKKPPRPRRRTAAMPADGKPRKPKTLASPLYNLPAAVVDQIRSLNLRRPKHLRLAHLFVENFFRENPWEIDDDNEENWKPAEVHALLDKLAEQNPQVVVEIAEVRSNWEANKKTVQQSWSANHERKANHYPVKPIVMLPIETGGDGCREVVE